MSVNNEIYKLLNKGNILNESIIQKYERQLLTSYLIALKNVRAELKSIYDRFAVMNPKTKKEILEYAFMRGQRLQRLQSQIEDQLLNMKDSKDIIKKAIIEGHIESYSFTGFALEKTLQAELGFGIISQRELNSILYNPMDKIKWSTRNIININKMTDTVRSEITRGIIEGKSFGEMSNSITELLNIGASKAIRIVRTETGRSQETGRKIAIDKAMDYSDEIGMKTVKIWDATLDNRTRQNHADMDGKEADETGKFLFQTMDGVYIYVDGPKLTNTTDDINCRCNLRLQFKDIPLDVRKDNESKKIIPYKTYNEWKSERGI